MFRSVPVTAELQGLATIAGKTGELKMTIDYTSFVEVYTIYSTFLFSKMTMVMVHNEPAPKVSVQSRNFWDTKYTNNFLVWSCRV